MSLNLKSARDSIRARVSSELPSLAKVYRNAVPTGWKPERDEFDRVKPHAIMQSSRPVPDYGRTLGDNEAQYPHIWPFSVSLFVDNRNDDGLLDDLGDALDAALIGFQPASDSGEIKGSAAYTYPVLASENVPARLELRRYMTCLVNLSRIL